MSYHGTHVVVIEIQRLWTRPRGVGATDLRLTNCLATGVGESRKGGAILYS